jgi:hypothetical protein
MLLRGIYLGEGRVTPDAMILSYVGDLGLGLQLLYRSGETESAARDLADEMVENDLPGTIFTSHRIDDEHTSTRVITLVSHGAVNVGRFPMHRLISYDPDRRYRTVEVRIREMGVEEAVETDLVRG